MKVIKTLTLIKELQAAEAAQFAAMDKAAPNSSLDAARKLRGETQEIADAYHAVHVATTARMILLDHLQPGQLPNFQANVYTLAAEAHPVLRAWWWLRARYNRVRYFLSAR